MSAIGPIELLIILAMLGLLLIPILIIVDAASRPDAQWVAAGESRKLWLALLVVGSLIPVLGVIPLIVYVASIRPKLKRATA